MSLKIFLSHAWNDKELPAFKAIEARLRESGHELWVDSRRIEYGDVIEDHFLAALKPADVFFVLWSKNAFASDAVKLEVQTAVDLHKRVVPCRIGAEYPKEFGPLNGRKYLNFHDNLELGLLQMTQYLIRVESAANPALAGHEEIQEQSHALGDALVEMDDYQFRKGRGLTGNAASSTYVSSMLEAGLKMIQKSSGSDPREKAALLQFVGELQQINSAHPRPEDEPLRQRLLHEALARANAPGDSPMLRSFEQALAAHAAGSGAAAPSSPAAAPARDASPPPAARKPAPRASTHRPEPPAPPPPTPLHAHVAAVLDAPDSRGPLRQRLAQLVPGPRQAAGWEETLVETVRRIPDFMIAIATSAAQAGIGPLLAPVLSRAEGYFFEVNDLIPDDRGVLGMLDDAYLVHAFLRQINLVCISSAGAPLVNYDPTPTLQVIGTVIGPGLAMQLDQAVNVEVGQIMQQAWGQQVARQPGQLDVSRSRTGGRGSWGPCVEDEMARMGAELGISMP